MKPKRIKLWCTYIIMFCTLVLFSINAFAQKTADTLKNTTAKEETKPKKGIDFHGQISTYLVTTIAQTQKNASKKVYSTIGNGLLPASISFLPYWENGDLKISGNLTPYISLNNYVNYDGTTSGDSKALQTNFVEFMQSFLEIKHKDYGSFLLGRNFGLYQNDAAFEDVAVLGVGVSRSIATPRQVHDLGLGYGYLFMDKYAQMNYTTPTLAGFNVTIGAYQPLSQEESGGSLGIQGKLTYKKDFNEKTKLYFSSSFITQKAINGTVEANTAANRPLSQKTLNAFGMDVFGKLAVGRITLSGQYNLNSGLGYYGILEGGTKKDPGDINQLINTSGYGYYAQLAYTTPKGFTLATNYGASQVESSAIFNIFPGKSDGNPTKRITVTSSQMIGSFLFRLEYTYMSKNPILGVVADRNLIVIGGTFLF